MSGLALLEEICKTHQSLKAYTSLRDSIRSATLPNGKFLKYLIGKKIVSLKNSRLNF